MEYKKYEKYRDSGLNWLGEIPEDWKLKRVKDISSVFNGATPKSGIDKFWDGEINWLTPEDISQNLFITESKRKVTKLGYESCGTSLVPINSIILTTRAPIGNLSINKVEVCTNQGCKSLVVKKNNYKFLYYLLLSKNSELQTLGSGTTFLELSTSKLRGYALALPPIQTQKAIAEYLDEKTAQIDKKIELLQAKKEKYQELRKTIINEAVTKGIDKAVELKDSGVEWLGKIPKHWIVIRSKTLFENISIKNHPDAKLLSIYRDYGVIEKSSRDDNHNRASDDLSNYKYVKKGFLVINKMKAWQGSVAISNYDGIVSPAYITCKPIIKGHNFYFHYLLRCTACITEFQKFSYGVRPDQWDLRYSDFADFMLTVPPIDEQIKIAEYLDEKTSKIDEIIITIDKNIEILNEFRKTLINDAVTGKIKVVSSENAPYERTAITG